MYVWECTCVCVDCSGGVVMDVFLCLFYYVYANKECKRNIVVVYRTMLVAAGACFCARIVQYDVDRLMTMQGVHVLCFFLMDVGVAHANEFLCLQLHQMLCACVFYRL